jgi:hypothetical protein
LHPRANAWPPAERSSAGAVRDSCDRAPNETSLPPLDRRALVQGSGVGTALARCVTSTTRQRLCHSGQTMLICQPRTASSVCCEPARSLTTGATPAQPPAGAPCQRGRGSIPA